MKKFGKIVVKLRFLLLAIFIVALVLSVIAIPKVQTTTDITTYLPENMMTIQGLKVLQEEFGMDSNLVLTLKDKSLSEMNELIGEVSQVNGISSVMWLGLFADLEKTPISEIDSKLLDMFYVNDTYVVFLTLSVPSSSQEAFLAVEEIENLASGTYYLGGQAVTSKQMIEGSLNEMYLYVGIAVFIILIILLLTSTSWIEPLIFLTTIGVSILLNMGSNIIFGSISIITYSASAILQLALALDYSVFMMHAYHDAKKLNLNSREAMANAIPKTFSSIFSSSLTTIGGFIALFFMRFTIGLDLGQVLAKGVVLSLITVLLLQPVLILMFDKLLDKTKHKSLIPRMNKFARFSISIRKISAIIALIALVPSVFLSQSVKYNYLEVNKEVVATNEAHQAQLDMGSQIIVIVPDTKMSLQYSFIQQASKVEGVNQVIGKYSFVPPILAPAIPDMLEDAFTSENNYTYYIIMLDGSDEDPQTKTVLSTIYKICDNTYPNFYVTGNAQAIRDLESITPTDFLIVSIVSAIIIFVILLFTMKKFGVSLLILLIVQLGIWINLSITSLSGSEINFMSYIIISSIQLGATVDYAIFFTNKYLENKKRMGNSIAVYRTILESVNTIISCMLILLSACLSVYFVSSNLIVSEITMLIARGALLASILVLVLLPACLLVFGQGMDEARQRRQRKKELKAKRNNNSNNKEV